MKNNNNNKWIRLKGNNPLILWGFRADLKDYAFFSLPFQLTGAKKRGGGGVRRRKKQKKSAQWQKRQEIPLSWFSLIVHPLFDVCNSDQFCSIEIPTVFCLSKKRESRERPHIFMCWNDLDKGIVLMALWKLFLCLGDRCSQKRSVSFLPSSSLWLEHSLLGNKLALACSRGLFITLLGCLVFKLVPVHCRKYETGKRTLP